MEETRGGKYGRNLAVWVRDILDREGEGYRERFLVELRTYSFEPKKKGGPCNSGIVRELEGIDEVDLRNPEEFARLVKEGFHLEYQKETSARVFKSLLDHL